MSEHSIEVTPYEKFLRESLEEEKKLAIQLNQEYSKAGQLKKAILKRRLSKTNENIVLLSADLKNYMNGLNYLREPSKERDEKAETLKPVPIEAILGQQPKPAPAQARPAPQVGARPAVSTAIGSPASPPTVEKPATAPAVGRPTIGQPIGVGQSVSSQPIPETQAQAQPSTNQPARPTIGTPIAGRPIIGTPIGTPPPQAPKEKKVDQEDTSARDVGAANESS